MWKARAGEDRQGSRWSRWQRLSGELVWIAIGNAAAVLGAVVSIRVLTEYLQPASYGELALAITLATLVNQTFMAPLTNGAGRFYAPAIEGADFGRYLGAVRTLVSKVAGTLCVLLLLILLILFARGEAHRTAIACAAILFAISGGANSILSGMQNAARQRSVVALHVGMEAWTRLLAAIAFISLLGATSAAAMFGYALAPVLVLISQYFFFRKAVPREDSAATGARDWHGEIWKYSWPFAAWGIFGWLQQASDRWALGLFGSTKEVGLYAALFQIGYYPISVASGIAVQFFTPIFYQRAGDATDGRRIDEVNRLSWQLTGFTLVLTAAACLLAILLHRQIFALLAAEEYRAVSRLLPWVVLTGGVFAAGQIIALNFMSQMKTRMIMVVKIVSSTLGAAFNVVLAYHFGISGVVIGGTLVAVLYLLWMVSLQSSTARTEVRA